MKNRKSWLVVLLILVVTVVVFYPSTQGEFLSTWDDNQHITENYEVQHLSWESVKKYFSSYYVASYQPIASLSFAIEYYFFGANATYYHFTNLAIHLINVVLVFLLLMSLFDRKKQFFVYFATLAFAIHPVQAELLGWISTRSTLLFSCFFLMATLCYLKHLQLNKGYGKSFALVVLFFVLSLLCKATAVIFPLVMLSLDYYVKKKYSWQLLLEKIPFFLVSFIFGYVSLLSRKVSDAQGDFNEYYSLYEKLSISSYSLFLYLKKTLVPTDLNVYYSYPYKLKIEDLIGDEFLLGPLWILMVLGVCWLVYRYTDVLNKKLWIFGLCFFLANIIIVLNVTPFSATFFAERYLYLGLIGIFIALIALIDSLVAKSPILKNATYLLFGVYGLVLVITARDRTHIWNDEYTLWSYVVNNANAQASYPYKHLGQIYAKRNQHQKAIEIYNKGVKANPYGIDLYYWRGISIAAEGDLNYAHTDFNRVISSKDNKFQTYKANAFYQKSETFKKQGLLDSVQVFLDSAKINGSDLALLKGTTMPENVSQLEKVGNKILKRIDSLFRQKDFKGMLEGYENLSLIFPNQLKYQNEKGKLEIALQRWESSVGTFSNILLKDENNKIARLSRAYAYKELKEYAKSIDDYSFAIKNLDSKNGEIYFYRAQVYFLNNQPNNGCSDLSEAERLGFNIGNARNMYQCK